MIIEMAVFFIEFIYKLVTPFIILYFNIVFNIINYLESSNECIHTYQYKGNDLN